MDGFDSPGRYEWLDFNAPMSSELADALASSLAARAPSTVLDIGCGWGELLLRVLVAAPAARGLGIDSDAALLDRARANAQLRHVDDRVEFRAVLAESPTADAVLCVGADHIFGTQSDALSTLFRTVTPGGRLLFGTGFWETAPTVDQAAALGARPDELASLAELVDLAIASGFRPLAVRTATRREWEEFEFGYLADWEAWLVSNPRGEAAQQIRERADTHRNGYLRGYRDVLGFAYLTLGRPET